MKRFFSKIMIFLGIFSLVMGTIGTFGMNVSYAEDLELIGKELGLVVEPSSTKLFDLSNLNPGDTKEAKITIKNKYTSPFQLYMRTERMSEVPTEGEPDMFKQLIITVYLGDKLVYSGSMMDFATSNISLGKFNGNANMELKTVVNLPGPETGNEFQGKGVDVKWIFIAQADKPEDPYEPPEDPYEPPKDPTPPTTSEEPIEEPEEPIEEEIIDEEIPEDIPEILEEPIEEIIEEEVPKDQPKMPKTGEISPIIYYSLGTLFLGLGIGARDKKKK